VARIVLPDRELVDGVTVQTDLGTWEVIETPGHAPSHVCFFQRDRRLLISGDHLLGRVSQYFDYGWTDDPLGEFLASLDRVEPLRARLCLSGHGRTFTDAQAHIDSNRGLVYQRLERVRELLREGERTAYELAPALFEQPLSPGNASWLMQETLCFLRHLEVCGEVERRGGDPERWGVASG
jgi:glyoxylase-like metal-dependent hydrolase (beta-lactamase superfamily II)